MWEQFQRRTGQPQPRGSKTVLRPAQRSRRPPLPWGWVFIVGVLLLGTGPGFSSPGATAAALMAGGESPVASDRGVVNAVHEKPMGALRVLTYNIQRGLGADGVADLDRVVDQLLTIDADIALLNEVDVNWRRSGNVDQPRYLQERAGYAYGYFGQALSRWASGNVALSRYGNLLLSHHPIVSARTVPLPVGLGREPRSAIVATVAVDQEPWLIIGTHLGLHQGERRRQTAELQRIVQQTLAEADWASGVDGSTPVFGVPAPASRDPGPIIVLGDFNARPDAPEIAALQEAPPHAPQTQRPVFVDAHDIAGKGSGYTFPYPEPYARIDYVFVSPALAQGVIGARPWPVPGSDHLPVVVDIVPASGR